MELLISFGLAILSLVLLFGIGHIVIKLLDFLISKFGDNVVIVIVIVIILCSVTFLLHLIRSQ